MTMTVVILKRKSNGGRLVALVEENAAELVVATLELHDERKLFTFETAGPVTPDQMLNVVLEAQDA